MENPETIRSEVKYTGKVLDLALDEIEYADGSRSLREVVLHRGGAAIVPILPEGSVILVRQYRHPFRTVITELPAGKIDPGEEPLACAIRELEEETGYRARRWEPLTTIRTTPGFCNEILHIFLATDLSHSPSGRCLDEGERGLSILTIPFDEVLAMIDKGEIVDGKSICGLLLTARRHTR